MAKKLNTWWRDMPGQRFWIEISADLDRGAALVAPDSTTWHRHLVRHAEVGDVVLHWRSGKQDAALIGVSRVAGPVEELTRTELKQRLGHVPAEFADEKASRWLFVPLEEYVSLDEPVTLPQLRAQDATLKSVRARIDEFVGSPSYLPFVLSPNRPLRMAQAYLTKLPSAFVDAIPELAVAVAPVIGTSDAPELTVSGLETTVPAYDTALDLTDAAPAAPVQPVVPVVDVPAAWVLQCDPAVWDLWQFVNAGNRVLTSWSVSASDHAAAMQPGDVVVLWVTGSAEAPSGSGVWGIGRVEGAPQWVELSGPEDVLIDPYWRDAEALGNVAGFVPVYLELFEWPLSAYQIADEPVLSQAEALWQVDGSNPKPLTAEQLTRLRELIPTFVPYPADVQAEVAAYPADEYELGRYYY